MSDAFYDTLRFLGRHAFWASSSPVVVGADRTRRPGPFLLAANHQSPYDVPILMRHCARRLDFISIAEVFRNPLVAWLYGSMNAFPLDRSRPDTVAVRTILDRLARGRAVAMFPEGGFRTGASSVIHGRRIRPGIGRVAYLAAAPILPCVIVNSAAYARFASWLPLRRTRYGVIFGDPIPPAPDHAAVEARLVEAFVELHEVLIARMDGAGATDAP